jgi:hypothetical protein
VASATFRLAEQLIARRPVKPDDGVGQALFAERPTRLGFDLGFLKDIFRGALERLVT